MRIRSTKPEFWTSRRIAEVSWDARLVLKGLESYVDDNGVGKDDIALLVTSLFSRDLVREPSRTLARVSEAISELHQAGLLWRYSHDGTDLLYLSFWDSIQRVDKAQDGRMPRPDGTYGYKESVIRECVASPREDSGALAPVTGEQGNRGTGEQGLSSDADASDQTEPKKPKVPEGFDEFWDAYSYKEGRKPAEAAYRAALRKAGVTPALLLEAATTYVAYQRSQGKHPEFTKLPTTWLRGEHWNDERSGRHLKAVDGNGERIPQPGDPDFDPEDPRTMSRENAWMRQGGGRS